MLGALSARRCAECGLGCAQLRHELAPACEVTSRLLDGARLTPGFAATGSIFAAVELLHRFSGSALAAALRTGRDSSETPLLQRTVALAARTTHGHEAVRGAKRLQA